MVMVKSIMSHVLTFKTGLISNCLIIDPDSSNGMFLRVKIDVYLVIELFFIVTTDNAYDNEEFEGSAVSSTGIDGMC